MTELIQAIASDLWKRKGTLMHIWKSANIFVFIWREYVEDFTLKHLLLSEIWTLEICGTFCLKTFRNKICLWIYYAYIFRNLQTSRANNSTILRIKNARFSGFCFHMNTNILGDFQICISVPLKFKLLTKFVHSINKL